MGNFVEFHVGGWPVMFNLDGVRLIVKEDDGRVALDFSPNKNIGVERWVVDEKYEEVKTWLTR